MVVVFFLPCVSKGRGQSLGSDKRAFPFFMYFSQSDINDQFDNTKTQNVTL